MRRERIALIALILIVFGIPAAALGYEYGLRPRLDGPRVIDIRAAAPENGGFRPDAIHVAAGETVTLRFHSVDVTHGIAIGPGLGADRGQINLGQVDAGHVAEVTVTFPQSGTYTFYCNTWCSRDHWRMRGVIEVGDTLPAADPDPVIEALIAEGIDIDAEHAPEAASSPAVMPSASRGETILPTLTVPADLLDAGWRFSHTPEQAVDALAAANPSRSRGDLADAAAALWLHDTSPDVLAAAAALYDKNCAACHGFSGGGDGPAANLTAEPPGDFTDPAHMLDVRSDVLYAKIRRGGMGTDMPNFGTVFTREETRALVGYLWRLAFAPEPQP